MRDQHRYGAVLALTMAVTLLALIVPDGPGGRAESLLAAGSSFFVAVITTGVGPTSRRAAGVAVAIGIAVWTVLVAMGVPSVAVSLAATAVLTGGTVGVLGGGLVRLIVERGVVLQAVFGALAVYMLVGLTFAFVIGALATGLDGSYFAQGTDSIQGDRVYFSFTALTTTGFGDLTAATRTGHALAVLEMLLGQLYLVTVIAMLVGNLRRRSS